MSIFIEAIYQWIGMIPNGLEVWKNPFFFSIQLGYASVRPFLYFHPPTLLRPILEVKRSKYRKGWRYENGRSTEKVELMRTPNICTFFSNRNFYKVSKFIKKCLRNSSILAKKLYRKSFILLTQFEFCSKIQIDGQKMRFMWKNAKFLHINLAWWLGYLISGTLVTISSIPMFLFPRHPIGSEPDPKTEIKTDLRTSFRIVKLEL